MSDLLIEARGLSVAYVAGNTRSHQVLRGIDLSLRQGESVGLVGESGSGKTTLGRALLGHLRGGGVFNGGTLRVAGIDVTDPAAIAAAGLRGRIAAMAPQNPLASLTHHLPVGSQIEEILRLRAGLDRKEARARALVLLDETGLPDPAELARRYPHQLSGGQRQRVVIAAALACDPRLLVLDEPTSALDKTTEAQVLALVTKLCAARDTGLVLISHDLTVVSRVCREVVVLRSGEVVEHGTTKRVLSHPRAAYTQQLLAAARGTASPRAAPGKSEPILAVRDLSFSWPGAQPAITRANFELCCGETLGIIGESGSGKSTLAALVAGLMPPETGSVTLNGALLAPLATRRGKEDRRRIQMVFQDPLSSLNPRQLCGAAVMRPLRHFFGLSRSAAQAEALGLFERLGLDATLMDRFPRQLSGGQQQRVAIARAFAARPDVLICDEITSALDAAVQMQVLDLLGRLQAETGCAALMITHDLAVLRRMSTRFMVLERGRIVESGQTADAMAAPRTPALQALVAASHILGGGQPARLPELEGLP